MRKIISILVVLGLVLTFSAVAMPTTAGAATCAANVTLSNNCSGKTDVVYNITFTATKTLLAGNDKLSVTFADETAFGAALTIDCGGTPVPPGDISKSAPYLDFVVPIQINAGSTYSVIIDDVTNPVTDGAKTLDLDYEFACCAGEDFACASYTIQPLYSDYSLMVDFDSTYPGIAEDFVPPFKACGQADNATGNETFDTELIGGNWYDLFDLILVEETKGCDTPCDNVTLSFNVTTWPSPSTGCEVHLIIDAGGGNETFTLTPTTSADSYSVANISLQLGQNLTWPSLLHFNTVGEYEICFDVMCPGDPAGGSCATGCTQGTEDFSIVDGPVCYPFNVHQWKDAAKMVLDEKWNLVSLPLVPFDTDIDVLLLSLDEEALDGDTVDDLVSIWHYDDEWTMYNGGGLTEMVDGASYWVRMTYPNKGAMPYNWWVWGTARPMPPKGPAAYPMAAGWNMMGFTSLGDMVIDGAPGYLWNFSPIPLVYGWDQTGSWMTSGWELISSGMNLEVGQGYWGYFTAAGTVVPP